MPAEKEPEYPKAMHLAFVTPIYVNKPKDEDQKIREGWSTQYVYQEFPVVLYDPNSKKTVTVGRLLPLKEAYEQEVVFIGNEERVKLTVSAACKRHQAAFKAEVEKKLAEGLSRTPSAQHFGEPRGPKDQPLPTTPEPGSPAALDALQKQVADLTALTASLLAERQQREETAKPEGKKGRNKKEDGEAA